MNWRDQMKGGCGVSARHQFEWSAARTLPSQARFSMMKVLRLTMFCLALTGGFVCAASAEQAKPPAEQAKPPAEQAKPPAEQAKPPAEQAKPPAELVQVRQAFAAAVSANKASAAAVLTHFPLKNSVFQEPPTVSRAGFGKLFADYRKMRKCISTEPLEKSGAGWTLSCDGNVLHFGLQGGRWMHTEYENVNE